MKIRDIFNFFKYRVKFSSFFKYFNKYYINDKLFEKNIWNFTNVISNNINNDIIFYTNNIVESFNSILNKKFLGFFKTMNNFKNALIDVINLYDMKEKYIEKKLSLTRALEHYIKIKNNFDLITLEDIKLIKRTYKEYLQNNN